MNEITAPAAASADSSQTAHGDTNHSNPARSKTARIKTGSAKSFLRFAGFASIGTLVFTGCGAIVESATENALEEVIEQAAESESGQDVEIDFDFDDENASFTIETDEGTMVFDGDEDGGTYTIEDEDGETSQINFGSATDAPDCVPSALRLPDGFVGQASMSGDGFCNFTAVAEGQLDSAGLADRYESALESLGYEEDDISRSTYASGGSEQITLMAAGDGNEGAMVGVSFQPEYYDANGNEGPATIINITITS